MSFTYKVSPPSFEVGITFGYDLLSEVLITASSFGSSLWITTEALLPLLPPLEDLITLPAGETIKNRAMRDKLEDLFYERGVHKESVIVAVGGGALLDLVGFVAATYMRGIPFISLPTTLLAMSDAALGGKNGINLYERKNSVGSFYHPQKIFCDLKFLETLPERTFREGFAETIKHGAMADERLFLFLEKHQEKLMEKDFDLLLSMIQTSVACKAGIVMQDPWDQMGRRALLNFGHTIAHALEASAKYQFSHGEAVALGMQVEALFAHLEGFLQISDFQRLIFLIKTFFPHLSLPPVLDYALVKKDKKGEKYVALTRIGEGSLCPLNETLFQKGWQDALRLLQK